METSVRFCTISERKHHSLDPGEPYPGFLHPLPSQAVAPEPFTFSVGSSGFPLFHVADHLSPLETIYYSSPQLDLQTKPVGHIPVGQASPRKLGLRHEKCLQYLFLFFSVIFPF